MTFRFEQFADAPSAQAAFQAAFPIGSSAELALQALVDMGAQCKSVGQGGVACRYIEDQGGLAGWSWHVAIVHGEKAIQHICISLGALGI